MWRAVGHHPLITDAINDHLQSVVSGSADPDAAPVKMVTEVERRLPGRWFNGAAQALKFAQHDGLDPGAALGRDDFGEAVFFGALEHQLVGLG